MIHSLNLDSFYLTEEQLENSPSRQDGIDKDTEANLRMYGCELIQEAGIMLGFHQVVMATGQVLLHRFYCQRSMKNFNVKKVAATALWVGAKLEEVKVVRDHPKKLLEMVVASVDRCITRREAPPGHKLGVLDIHSKEGEEFRRSLIRYESEMLKAFGFIMNVEHPHRLLCNYAQIMFLPYITNPDAAADKRDFVTNFIQVAWNVANDSLRTTLCVRFKGSVTACGIIFYTARKLQVPMPENWWELFTVNLEDMCEVCRVLHELYLAKKATFVPVCHQLLPSKPPTPAIAAGGAGAKGGVTATPTPMLGATPELNTRPGDKPLDPSVRRVVPASASTPSLVQVAAAAAAGAANGSLVLASPEGPPAPGSARKRSRSPKSPAEDGDLRKRQQLDSKQPDTSGARREQQLQQQAQEALAAAGAALQRPSSAAGDREGGDRGLKRPGSAAGDRDGDRDRSRHGDRDRDRGSDRSRRDRPRSRSRDRSSRRSRSRDRKGRRSRSRERERARRSRSRSRERSRRSRSRSRDRRREREREQRDSKDRSGRDRSNRDRGGENKSPLKPKQQQQQREPSSPSRPRQPVAGTSSGKPDKAAAAEQGPAGGRAADSSSRDGQQQQHGSSANGSHKAPVAEQSRSQPELSKPAEDVNAAKAAAAAAAAGGSSKAGLPPVQPKAKPKAVRKHPPAAAGVTSPVSSPSADVGNAPGVSAPGTD